MLHHRLDMGFEVVGQIQDLLLPQGLALRLHSLLLIAQALHGKPVLLEERDRLGDLADFVGVCGKGHLGRIILLGQPFHDCRAAG